MSQWYFSKNGQALGPFAEDQFIQKIQAGEITAIDLVYESGETEWRPLSSVPELFQHVSSSEPQAELDSSPKEWVLLKKHSDENSKEFKQIGPFSQNQVLDLVDRGEIRFSDFAWKQGMESWAKIATLDEFSKPLPSSPAIDPSLYESEEASDQKPEPKLTAAEMLENIERFDALSKVSSLEPEPAMTDDLQEPASEIEIEEMKVAETSEENQEVVSTSSTPYEDFNQPVDAEPNLVGEQQAPGPVQAESEDSDLVVSKSNPLADFGRSIKDMGGKLQGLTIAPNRDKAMAVMALLFICIAGVLIFQGPDDEEVLAADEVQDIEMIEGTEVVEAEMAEPAPVVPVAPINPPVPERAISKVQPTPEKKTATKVARKKTKKIVSKVSSKKKKLLDQQIAKVKSSKRKSVVKKSAVRGKAQQAKGGAKAQSYYKQRDRLALFYSSLKAETLAVEIDRQYRKIGKNKSAWNRYYQQWRKKVRVSLSKDIREFPKKSEKYAYPKVLAAFKKDYGLFYKYGAAYDAKVKGGRRPSGLPRDLKGVFTRYKKQAQSLGR